MHCHSSFTRPSKLRTSASLSAHSSYCGTKPVHASSAQRPTVLSAVEIPKESDCDLNYRTTGTWSALHIVLIGVTTGTAIFGIYSDCVSCE